MNTKYVYSAVLLIVLSAWLGHSTTKPPTPPKPQEKDSKQVVSQIVADPAMLRIKSGAWIAGGNCNIEFANGAPMSDNVYPLAKDRILKLAGWALDAEKVLLPEQIVVRFTSVGNTEFYAASLSGLTRDDVREYFKLPDRVSNSGFELATNLRDVPAGQYSLTLVLQYDDATYVCDNGRKILVP